MRRQSALNIPTGLRHLLASRRFFAQGGGIAPTSTSRSSCVRGGVDLRRNVGFLRYLSCVCPTIYSGVTTQRRCCHDRVGHSDPLEGVVDEEALVENAYLSTPEEFDVDRSDRDVVTSLDGEEEEGADECGALWSLRNRGDAVEGDTDDVDPTGDEMLGVVSAAHSPSPKDIISGGEDGEPSDAVPPSVKELQKPLSERLTERLAQFLDEPMGHPLAELVLKDAEFNPLSDVGSELAYVGGQAVLSGRYDVRQVSDRSALVYLCEWLAGMHLEATHRRVGSSRNHQLSLMPLLNRTAFPCDVNIVSSVVVVEEAYAVLSFKAVVHRTSEVLLMGTELVELGSHIVTFQHPHDDEPSPEEDEDEEEAAGDDGSVYESEEEGGLVSGEKKAVSSEYSATVEL